MGLFRWLAGALSSFFGSAVVRFIALKIVLTTLMVVTLPIVLNNFAYKLLDLALNQISQSSSLSPAVINLTGLGAFFAERLNLVQVFNVIIAAVMTRFTLKLIPFVRT